MSQGQPITNESVRNESEEPPKQHLPQTPIDRILKKLSSIELHAQEQSERYMRHE
jgi:hypothetical protein